MTAYVSNVRRILSEAIVLFALIPALAGCGPFGGPHYTPAGASVDPYRVVRAQAQQFYQAGVAQEQQGHWREALDDYQQARLWDPDNRQDIQDALNRMQARVDGPAPAPTVPSSPKMNPSPAPTPPSSTQHAEVPTRATGVSKAQMQSFKSQRLPYSISYPQGWLEKSGGTSQQPIDTFVGQTGSNAAAVVSITEEPTGGATLDELAAAVKQQLQAAGINDVQLAERRQVGGLPAYLLAYHVTDGAMTSTVRHAIFVTPGQSWHVILLAVPGATPDLLKNFDAMLDSLQLLSPAFPQA